MTTDIVERLRQVQGDNEDAREAAAKITQLRTDYSILKTDYDALRAEAHDLLLTVAENILRIERMQEMLTRRALEPKP